MSLTARRPVSRSTQRTAVSALASWGLATRATNYVLVGVLVLTLAMRGRAEETDQHGALEETTRHTGGTALVWAIAFGLFAYAAWRYYEAAFGVRASSSGSDVGPRLLSLFRGAVYTVLGASAVQVATNSGASNHSSRQQQWSGQIMAQSGGRWAIGAVGVGLVAFGIVQILKGLRRSFEKKFELERMGPATRQAVRVLGTVGCPGRGVVFLLVGVFVTVAAVEYDPKQAGGLDRVLRELHDTAAGPWLLTAVGLGLIVFGLYGYCEAVWRRT